MTRKNNLIKKIYINSQILRLPEPRQSPFTRRKIIENKIDKTAKKKILKFVEKVERKDQKIKSKAEKKKANKTK